MFGSEIIKDELAVKFLVARHQSHPNRHLRHEDNALFAINWKVRVTAFPTLRFVIPVKSRVDFISRHVPQPTLLLGVTNKLPPNHVNREIGDLIATDAPKQQLDI